MWVLDFLTKYGLVFSLIFQLGLSLFLLWGRDKFAPKSLSGEFYENKDKVEDQFHEFALRLSSVEQNLKNLPTTKEFHELKLQMCDLAGELKRSDETLSAFKDHVKRLDKSLRIMDEYLRSQK